MRVGVFGNHDSWYVSELCREGQQRGHVMQPLHFEQCHSTIAADGVSLRCGTADLLEFDTVLVRTMPPGTLEQVVARMDQLAGLETKGVGVLNSPRSLECAVDKYLTTQRLALAGIPVPLTVVCENADTALEAFEQLGRDVIIKPLFGAEGRGIMRVSDPELALRAFRTLDRLGAVIYQQQFVAGPGFDLRILLLGDNLIGSMKRTPKPGDFRANISQHGIGTPHTPTDQEMRLALSATQVTGCVFAGVDLMYDHRHQPLVIEVNAVPGWRALQNVCRINVPERLFQWLEGGHPDSPRIVRDEPQGDLSEIIK